MLIYDFDTTFYVIAGCIKVNLQYFSCLYLTQKLATCARLQYQYNRSIEFNTKTKATLKETQYFFLFTFVYACRSISISVYECFIFPIHVIEIFGVIDLTMFHLCFRIYSASTKVFVHWKDLFFKFLSAFEYEKQYHEPKLQINNLLSFIFNDKRRNIQKAK
jgi:hypothetical protein